jgi:hypothetical protein
MWKEIGKSIIKATIIAEGTKLMIEDVLPKAQELSKKAWKRIKKDEPQKSKKTMKVEVKQEETASHKPAKTKVIHSSSQSTYDADYQDR